MITIIKTIKRKRRESIINFIKTNSPPTSKSFITLLLLLIVIPIKSFSMSCQRCIAIWGPSNCTHCLANSNCYECHTPPLSNNDINLKIQEKLNSKKFVSKEIQRKNNAKK